jgi:hypothetical protein
MHTPVASDMAAHPLLKSTSFHCVVQENTDPTVGRSIVLLLLTELQFIPLGALIQSPYVQHVFLQNLL